MTAALVAGTVWYPLCLVAPADVRTVVPGACSDRRRHVERAERFVFPLESSNRVGPSGAPPAAGVVYSTCGVYPAAFSAGPPPSQETNLLSLELIGVLLEMVADDLEIRGIRLRTGT